MNISALSPQPRYVQVQKLLHRHHRHHRQPSTTHQHPAPLVRDRRPGRERATATSASVSPVSTHLPSWKWERVLSRLGSARVPALNDPAVQSGVYDVSDMHRSTTRVVCVNVRVCAPPELRLLPANQEVWRPAVRPRGKKDSKDRKAGQRRRPADDDQQRPPPPASPSPPRWHGPRGSPSHVSAVRSKKWAGLASSQLVQGKCRNFACAPGTCR